jgi:hypothetical protein
MRIRLVPQVLKEQKIAWYCNVYGQRMPCQGRLLALHGALWSLPKLFCNAALHGRGLW